MVNLAKKMDSSWTVHLPNNGHSENGTIVPANYAEANIMKSQNFLDFSERMTVMLLTLDIMLIE